MSFEPATGATTLDCDPATWPGPARMLGEILAGGSRPANLRLEATGAMVLAPDGTGTFFPDGSAATWRVEGPDGGGLPHPWLGGARPHDARTRLRLVGRVAPPPADPPAVLLERITPP